MSLSIKNSAQLSAIAWLRWRLFVNALRTTPGKLELLSRTLISIAFTVLGLGGAFGMGLLAFICLSQGKPQLLAIFFWIVDFVNLIIIVHQFEHSNNKRMFFLYYVYIHVNERNTQSLYTYTI